MGLRDRVNSLRGYLVGSERSGRIYRLAIEVTNACNLRCTMCPRGMMRRKVEHMDISVFEQIIAENKASLEFVSLNGYGEPLLYPRLFDCFEICRKYGVRTGISTNCTRLSREMGERLLREGPDLLILAVDSVVKESYEQVRVGATLETVLDNVSNFLRMRERKRGHTFVVLQCIYMTETKSQIRDFFDRFSQYRYDALRIRQLTYSGRSRTDDNYRNRDAPCYWLWTEPMILSNGTVVPCCQDVNGELALGNIKEHSLSELWKDGRIVNLRSKHAAGERARIPVCKDCNMYQPGTALAVGASVFDTGFLNRWLPSAETALSFLRYRWDKKEK